MLSSHSFIHCGIIKILKFNFLTQNFSLCCRAAGDVKHTFSFSLSLSLSSLCCVIYPRGRSSVHSSKTPNGLQRVPTGYNGSQRVPTGLRGGGGEERSMTRLLSPHNIYLYIIYLKKFYFYSYLFPLCNNPPFKLYI